MSCQKPQQMQINIFECPNFNQKLNRENDKVNFEHKKYTEIPQNLSIRVN